MTEATLNEQLTNSGVNNDAQGAGEAGANVAGSANSKESAGAAAVDANKGDGGDKQQGAVPDWRAKMSGGDEKIAKRIGRYASEKAVAEALIAAQNRISEGVQRIKPDSTPEEIAAYREAMGIPEKHDGYDLKGYEIKDTDKMLVNAYLEKAHATNQTPEQVRAGLDAFYSISAKMAEERNQNDAKFSQETEDSLRTEWGDDFRKNVNLIKSFLDQGPEGLKDRILKGRLSDGRPIGSDPDVLRWLLSLELERNPVGIVAPSSGETMAKSVDDEIKKIEYVMRKDRAGYNKDEAMQKRYRDLLDYRIQQNEKGRKAA